MGVRVFFCEPTDQVVFDLRIYESGEGVPACPLMGGDRGYHNAHSERLGQKTEALDSQEPVNGDPSPYEGDPRWPKACGCGFVFSDKAQRMVWRQRLIRRVDTGEVFEGYRSVPVGGVWSAPWMADHWAGEDGRCLVCKLPGDHDWIIDSRASNCTMPDDNVHKCWVRHGRPEDGTLHVDKNGHTCAAGAGSIAIPGYHGFLHNGELTSC